jgi:hypothetical protein
MAIFPPAANARSLVSSDSMGDVKVQLLLNNGRVFECIDGRGKDRRAYLIEFLFQLIEGDQLPPAECSPMTSIEQQDLIGSGNVIRQYECVTTDGSELHVGKRCTSIKLIGHERFPSSNDPY